jgi:hypothetical protein
MSRSFGWLWVFGALAILASASLLAGEAPWFDMANCEMCKPLADEPNLLMNMSWEQHNISNGIVSVTTVKEDYMGAYRKAQVRMEEVSKRLQKGEKVALCGGCTAVGQIMMKGVHSEAVPTSHGEVWILTSADPQVVTELQAWGARNTEEMNKVVPKKE